MALPRYDKLPEPMPEEQRLRETPVQKDWDAIIIGGGIAGLSAAIYLGRAMRRALVLDAEESLACWEPEVQNYFGFPDGIDGRKLLKRGREQAKKFGAEILVDEVETARIANSEIIVHGRHVQFRAKRLLIATGLYHLPPKFAGVNECIGHSLFFCKDCDGYKVRDKAIAVVGRNNEAVEYALGLTIYSPTVIIATNGEKPLWDEQHSAWIEEYQIPIYSSPILEIEHKRGHCSAMHFEDQKTARLDFIFTTRGDIYYNQIAKQLGVNLDQDGQIIVDRCQQTNIPNVYAAGCITQANCQMIIAAGHGAAAAQAINRSLFEESLANHSLKRCRAEQIRSESTEPEVVQTPH
jgi:thioredoxin reductase (NADPH)